MNVGACAVCIHVYVFTYTVTCILFISLQIYAEPRHETVWYWNGMYEDPCACWCVTCVQEVDGCLRSGSYERPEVIFSSWFISNLSCRYSKPAALLCSTGLRQPLWLYCRQQAMAVHCRQQDMGRPASISVSLPARGSAKTAERRRVQFEKVSSMLPTLSIAAVPVYSHVFAAAESRQTFGDCECCMSQD